MEVSQIYQESSFGGNLADFGPLIGVRIFEKQTSLKFSKMLLTAYNTVEFKLYINIIRVSKINSLV